MITSNIDNFSSMSTVKAKVDLYSGSTLVKTCTCSDVLEQFKINRDGDTSKFFGFGICHKLSIDFIDLDRELEITTANTAVVGLGNGTIYDAPYPKFYITEVNRDEKTNSITATAYDKLYSAASYTVEDLSLTAPYTIGDIANACATVLGVTIKLINVESSLFNTSYSKGANFGGDEDVRSVLNAIAEATQSIYYINSNEEIVFKRPDIDGAAVHTVTKDTYYELNTKANKKLTAICSATELGDNLEATTGESGTTQYIRNNPLWDLHADRATFVDNAVTAIGGLTINQIECDWSGDYRLEIGDKIDFVTNGSDKVTSYLLCDSIEYAGTFNEVTKWEYSEQTSDTAANPTNIGDRINQTFAKVDKVNKRIDLVASEIAGNAEQISKLQIDTGNITASVKDVSDNLASTGDALNGRINTVTKEVALKVNKQQVEISVEERLQEGVEKVVTSAKKYTFDDTGLNISSNSSNINTIINEDGMTIYRAGQEVLTADNSGVRAEDLHATTYLIIGNTSRLEDRNYRTACFWIGD